MTGAAGGHDPISTFVRRAAAVRDEDLVSQADPNTQEALMHDITTSARSAAHGAAGRAEKKFAPPRHPRRVRRGLIAVVAILAVGGSVAAGWAALRGSPREQTTVACATPGGTSYIDAVTGDPLVDCATAWQRETGHEPPTLVAYRTAGGGVVVVPKGSKVPADYRPLGRTFTQDSRLIELAASLNDWIGGLNARCNSGPQSRALASRHLNRLGLTGWTPVFIQRSPDGRSTCGDYIGLDHVNRRVQLGSMPAAGPSAPDRQLRTLANRLGAEFATGCRKLDDAATEVTSVATRLGFSPARNEIQVNQVPDPKAACTRIDMAVGGTASVTLRGPK